MEQASVLLLFPISQHFDWDFIHAHPQLGMPQFYTLAISFGLHASCATSSDNMESVDGSVPVRLALDNVRRQSDHAPAQEGGLTTSEHSTLTTAVVFGCLATISVVIAIRLMVKKMMAPHRLSADDFLVLAAAAFTVSFCMVSLGGKLKPETILAVSFTPSS